MLGDFDPPLRFAVTAVYRDAFKRDLPAGAARLDGRMAEILQIAGKGSI
ncbi:MAG: hypothetical protein IPI83_07635 [Sphingomonadales bacterium]|nr:hypothetical protein [Sphingomonadales bacterium]